MLRRLLSVDLTCSAPGATRGSLTMVAAAIERAGILVFQAAGIAKRDAGFLARRTAAAVIGVNRKLRHNGRTFTLLHECVHVYLDQSSICDIEEGPLRPPRGAARRGVLQRGRRRRARTA